MALALRKRTAADTEDEALSVQPVKVKVAKPKSSKPWKRKILKGARYVLFIGDEGAILLFIKDNAVVSRQFVPDASEQNLEELRESLAKNTKAPLALVIDNMDQAYTQQTLPPVSAMSVNKLIARRLERDLAPTDIKGSILLGREKTGRKDWNFLMVSIERSRQVALWLDFVLAIPNRFLGIYLVPAETEIIVRELEHALGVPKEGTGAKWKFFISHNKLGGFRQVFLRNGRIVFTRMSQPIGESTPEVIAGNIEQEIQSTLEYMKRLAYDPQDGLDVYIVAASVIKPLIDKNKVGARTFHVISPYELAQYFAIEGMQPTDQFGDAALAAAIATSPKHVLKLFIPESKRYDMLYMTLRMQRGAAVLGILGILGYAGSITSDIYMRYLDEGDLQHEKTAHQRNLTSLKEEVKNSRFSVDVMGDPMEQYQQVQKQQVSPLAFLKQVRAILRPPIVIKAVNWSVGKTAKAEAVITLQLPGVEDVDTFKKVSKKLLEDLKAGFKGFDIVFDSLPAKYTDSSISMSFDNAAPPPTESADVRLKFRQL